MELKAEMSNLPQEELFPGIPHDVTLNYIVTKLPWAALHVLSSVSKSWGQAIESREVYNARARSKSAETLVVVRCGGTISLYSMREKAFYHVPAVSHDLLVPKPWDPRSKFPPLVSTGGTLLESPRLVSASGKLYLFREDRRMDTLVLDLRAGEKQWKRCANLQEPQHECSISIRCAEGDHGDSASAYGGDGDWFKACVQPSYRLVDGEWRIKTPWRRLSSDSIYWTTKYLMVQGKQYRITKRNGKTHDINVLDICNDTKSWKRQHSLSWEKPGSELRFFVVILPANNELVAIAYFSGDDGYGYKLIQTRGFGTESKEIMLEELPLAIPCDESYFYLRSGLSTIQL